MVFADHLNILYDKNTSQGMVKWRLIVEQFAQKEIRHIAEEENAVVDCLSRLNMEHWEYNLIETEVLKPRLQYCNML